MGFQNKDDTEKWEVVKESEKKKTLEPKQAFVTVKNQKGLSKMKENRSYYNLEKLKTSEFQEVCEHLQIQGRIKRAGKEGIKYQVPNTWSRSKIKADLPAITVREALNQYHRGSRGRAALYNAPSPFSMNLHVNGYALKYINWNIYIALYRRIMLKFVGIKSMDSTDVFKEELYHQYCC